MLATDIKDCPVRAIGIEHDRRRGMLANDLRQLTADNEPGVNPCYSRIEVSRFDHGNRETGAQEREFAGEDAAVHCGLICDEDVGTRLHALCLLYENETWTIRLLPCVELRP